MLNVLKTVWILSVLLVFALLVPDTPAFAAEPSVSDWIENGQTEEPAEAAEVSAAEETGIASIIVKLVLYTGLILVLIYGLIKFLALRQKKLQPNQAIRLMGGTSLGNNKSLQLVKVGGQVYMIGVGEQITLIKEFSDEDEIGDIENSLDAPSSVSLKPMLNFAKTRNSDKAQRKQQGFESLFRQSLDRQKASGEQLKQELHKENDKQEGRSL